MKLALVHTPMLLIVGVLLMTPVAHGLIRGVLMCENEGHARTYNVRGRDSDYNDLRPCYAMFNPGPRTGCKSVQTTYMDHKTGVDYDTFQWAYVMQLQCDWGDIAGLCRYDSRTGSWSRVTQCPYSGCEAIVTLVHDHSYRRRLRGKGQDEEQDDVQHHKAPTEQVEIDGQPYTIIGFNEDEEEDFDFGQEDDVDEEEDEPDEP